MSGHPENSPFFQTHPTDWTITAFLDFCFASLTLQSSKLPNVLHRWVKSLRTISNCLSEPCCSRTHRDRAKFLLARFEKKGKDSDQVHAKAWLREWSRKQQQAKQNPPVTKNNNINVVLNNNLSEGSTIGGIELRDLKQVMDIPQGGNENRRDVPTPALDDSQADDEIIGGELEREILETPSAERTAFAYAHSLINDDQKWFLSSGRCVEDIILEVCTAMHPDKFKTSLLRLFVLDLSDPAAVGWFTPAELKEIQLAFPPLPQPDKVLAESLKRFFPVRTTQQLDNVLSNPSQRIATSPITFWSDLVHRNLLSLLSSRTMPLCTPRLEAWYTALIWSNVIDHGFLSLPVNIIRDEAVCRASSRLLNQARAETGGPANRQRLGPRLDGIICTNAVDFLELGAIEVAKSYDGEGATKWLDDGKKLRGVLRDMLTRLHEVVEGDERVSKIQTVGILNAGLTFQMVRCWGRSRGGVVLCKSEKREEYPTVVEELRKVWFLLRAVAQARDIVDEVRNLVQQGIRKTDDEVLGDFLREN